MRFIKLIIISIVLLFGVVMLISALIPSHVRISRAININTNPASIRPMIEDLRKWQNWNLLATDSLRKVEYEPALIRARNMTIKRPGQYTDSVKTVWNRHDQTIHSTIALMYHTDQVVTVQWFFDFRLRWYPWEKFASIVFDKQMGPPMEQSLMRLKELAEQSDLQ